MKSLSISPLFLIFIIILSTISHVHASSIVNVTVTTDKQAYYSGETVRIYGNLTFNETLVTDGLVGIQVQNPEDSLLIIRTVNTGTNPSTTPYVGVRSVIPCDSSGSPKESFKRGTLAYFKITVTNYDIEPREALMTINIYNSNNIPFGSASIKTTLDGQTTPTFIISIPIPADATTGNATAYANAYTDWPRLEGTPYCPEKSSPFQIINGESSQTTTGTATLEVNGNYNTTFKLAPGARAGNYTIYVSSRYFGEETFNNTTFKAILLGDFDGDGDIDISDIRYFSKVYMGKLPFDPKCDFDQDGDIDIDDIRFFAKAYIAAP